VAGVLADKQAAMRSRHKRSTRTRKRTAKAAAPAQSNRKVEAVADNATTSRFAATLVDSTRYVFTFGMHKGQTLAFVLATSPAYLVWAHLNVEFFKLSPRLQDLVQAFLEQQAYESKMEKNLLAKSAAVQPERASYYTSPDDYDDEEEREQADYYGIGGWGDNA